jgi:adenylate cyclase
MGYGVTIAARLEGIADPGGISISEDAYRQVRDRLKENFIDLGEKELKNIARPLRVFAIKTGSVGPAVAPDAAERAEGSRGRSAAARRHRNNSRADRLRRRCADA